MDTIKISPSQYFRLNEAIAPITSALDDISRTDIEQYPPRWVYVNLNFEELHQAIDNLQKVYEQLVSECEHLDTVHWSQWAIWNKLVEQQENS